MSGRDRRFGLTVLLPAVVASSPAGAAESRIGNTDVVRNSVVQVTSGAPSAIRIGDDVFADEKVRTGQGSAAKFVFSDRTNLAVGPSAQVTLDRSVYKGETSCAKAAVNFAAGTVRFTTGGSDKGAYELKTATATIGVRGTQFDLSVRGGLTCDYAVEDVPGAARARNIGARIARGAGPRRWWASRRTTTWA